MDHIHLIFQFSHSDCASKKSCTPASLFSLVTPHGNMFAIADNTYLYALQFEESTTFIKTLTTLRQHPEINLCLREEPSILESLIRAEIERYFDGTLTHFTIPYKFLGTPFQQRVWKALTTISVGNTATYQSIAHSIGTLKGARAVGNANNRNPISIIIPCHRVIASDNTLAGYAGGIDKKKLLLIHEGHSGKTFTL